MSKCWYCNEEITTGNNPEHLGICDKCYDEMFKCGNEFIRNMVNKIADLEAKLAESFTEKDVESLIRDREDTIKFLKQQLAEKDEEIKRLNNIIFISQLQAPEEQRLKIIGSSCCQYNPKRDKISFAVEQLEKVKEVCSQVWGMEYAVEAIEDFIDNQINELKEMK